MSETPYYSDLQAVPVGITPQLRDEIQQLVEAKYDVDELARHGGAGRHLTTPFHDGGYGPKDGLGFFRAVLPFSDLENDGDAFSALVPVSQTIGASWRWSTGSVPETERPALLARLQDPARAEEADRERAEFFWIKPLGLFLAHEEKNRVGFFRDMDAQWIPARVMPCDYPVAKRLAIYRVKHQHQTMYWAVLGNRLLEPMNHPDWALPVLRAYGVREHHQWPHDFPPVDVTAAALTARLVNPVSSRPAPLDLQLVLEREAYEAEDIPCAMMDIDPVKIPSRFFGAMAGLAIVGILLINGIPDDWPNVRIVAGMVAGAGMFGTLMPLLKIFRLPRRLIDPYASLRKFSSRERKAAGIR
ncbi:hypothetical protein V4C53_45270 [Paraburkholderia azotifigens]|uniref:hypothetical protein n=1 Tax=Paraburkholderia azotifigens TaxID=2057004 RepID=UPI00317DF8A4